MPTLLPQDRRPEAVFAISVAALVISLGSILATATSEPSGLLEIGVALDLTLGLPVLGYLFLIRTGRAGRGVLVPLGATGFAFAALVIPGVWAAGPFRWQGVPWDLILVAVEGGALLMVLLRANRIRRRYLEPREDAPHPSDAMRTAFEESLGSRFGAVAFGEASLLWYGCMGWGRGPSPSATRCDATVPPGQGAMVGALVLLAVVETVALHLVVHLWSPLAAWLLTASSLYGVLWLLGDLHATRIVPTRFGDRGLHIRAGLRWRHDAEWAQVVDIHTSEPGCDTLSTAFLRSPDLWIEFKAPQRVVGPMGLRKSARVVGVSAADPQALKEGLSRHLSDAAAEAGPE